MGWANGLKFSGYATDPSYPSKLIKIIESYKLYEFDEPISLPKKKTDDFIAENTKQPEKEYQGKQTQINTERINKPEKINDLKTVRASGGESIKELAIRNGENVFDLLEYNEGIASQDHILYTGEIIFLQKKKKSYQEEDNAFHKVEKGETMYEIAQKYVNETFEYTVSQDFRFVTE